MLKRTEGCQQDPLPSPNTNPTPVLYKVFPVQLGHAADKTCCDAAEFETQSIYTTVPVWQR